MYVVRSCRDSGSRTLGSINLRAPFHEFHHHHQRTPHSRHRRRRIYRHGLSAHCLRRMRIRKLRSSTISLSECRCPQPRQRLTAIEGDIRDRDRVAEPSVRFKPDTIIHLAAVHHIPTCERRRAYALEVNVVGTELLLEAAEAHGVSRFVLASSGAVYDWKNGELRGRQPVESLRQLLTRKADQRKSTRVLGRPNRRRGLTARIFNTIGHDDPNAHLVPDIIAQIPQGESSVEIALGNLTPRRDYIHADDTARAIAGIAVDLTCRKLACSTSARAKTSLSPNSLPFSATSWGIKISVTKTRPASAGSTGRASSAHRKNFRSRRAFAHQSHFGLHFKTSCDIPAARPRGSP